jgi:hypothetical protein
MAAIITYLDSEPKFSDTQKSGCKCNVYPFMVTKKTCHRLDEGCEANMSDRNCDDCCWMCLPCSLTIDIITFLPFLIIYGCKKCLNK